MPDRREFLKIGAAGLAAALTACSPARPGLSLSQAERESTAIAAGDKSKAGLPVATAPALAPTPELLAPSEKFTVPQLQKLGKELEEWRLANGKLAVEVFSYIKTTIDMLKGVSDPRAYVPAITPPIVFDNHTSPGQFGEQRSMFSSDSQDSRTIIVDAPGGLSIRARWLKADTSLTIAIDKPIMERTVRMVFAEKEMRILTDWPAIDRYYLKWAQEQGVKFSPVINPDNIPFTTREYEFNCAALLRHLELKYNNGISYYDYLNDYSSHIRSGVILYVNWALGQYFQGIVVPEEEPWSKKPMSLYTSLKELKLVKESGGIVTWASGQPPEVGSASFNAVMERIMLEKPRINF